MTPDVRWATTDSPTWRTATRRQADSGAATARRDGATATAEPFAESRLEDLVVITGFSGAGKSTAMDVFEDAGYFCVDNLPPEMIRALVELFVHEGSKVERAAVVSDVRGGDYFEALRAVLDELARAGRRATACCSSTPTSRRCSRATRRRAGATRWRRRASVEHGHRRRARAARAARASAPTSSSTRPG